MKNGVDAIMQQRPLARSIYRTADDEKNECARGLCTQVLLLGLSRDTPAQSGAYDEIACTGALI